MTAHGKILPSRIRERVRAAMTAAFFPVYQRLSDVDSRYVIEGLVDTLLAYREGLIRQGKSVTEVDSDIEKSIQRLSKVISGD